MWCAGRRGVKAEEDRTPTIQNAGPADDVR
jgi:hypothetical protein